MKKRSLWLCPLAIAAIVTLDQWVKAYIVTHFAVGESAEFLPRLLRLHYVRNFGAAWSSFSGERWLLIGVTGVGMLAPRMAARADRAAPARRVVADRRDRRRRGESY